MALHIPTIEGVDPIKVIERGFATPEEYDKIEQDKHAVQVNLIYRDGQHEGVWVALISKRDRDRYENESSFGETIFGVLLNQALAFFPNRSLGTVIEALTRGASRPVCRVLGQQLRLRRIYKAYVKGFIDPLVARASKLADEGWYYLDSFDRMLDEYKELESAPEPTEKKHWKGPGWYNVVNDWEYKEQMED